MTLPITQVTVHPDGALVTRSGPLQLTGGTAAVLGLPLMLDPTSVRVWLSGGAVAEVHTEIDLQGVTHQGTEALIESFVEARDALSVLDATLEALREKRRALASLVPGPGSDPEAEPPTPAQLMAWREADPSITAAVARVDGELARRLRERRTAVEALAILETQVEEASTQQLWRRWAPTRRVRIRIPAGTTEQLEAILSYRIGGASWTPSYTLDADEALRVGRFAMRAVVVQATGEDWSQVSLTLSSAASGRWIDVPELAAMRLGTAGEAARSGFRALPPDLDALFPDDLPSMSAPGDDLAREQGSVPEGGGRGLEQDQRPEPGGSRGQPGVPLEAKAGSAVARTGVAWGGAPPASAPAEEPTATLYEASCAEAMPRSSGLGGAASVVLAPVAGAAALASAALSRRGDSRAAQDLSTGSGITLEHERGTPGERREEEGAGGLEVEAGWLDYGALRLDGWGAPVGRRGRLRVVAELEWLSEQGAPPEARARLSSRIDDLCGAFSAVAQRPLPPHHVLPGPVEGADVSICAVGAVDIPSDGLPHSVAVEAWAAEIHVAYRAVPRHDPRAFRRVTAEIDYPRPLLPGPVDVYVGGQLELTSPWAGSPGAGRLRIGLGAEDRIKLVRNVRYHEEAAGVFGGSRRLHTTVEVEIASSLPAAAQLEILERIPVALDRKELWVEVTDAVPPAQVYEGEPDGPILKGGRAQRVEVDAHGEARAILSYAVTLGGRDELVGGDRRG